jgi:phenylacetate-CoA oxygenase PaaI subunit
MTTKAEREFESTQGMSDACAAGLRNALLAVADTKLLLGYHYGEWTFGPPELEAAIANCSLSQTELGHVRLLHAILRNHFGDDPDDLVEARSSSEFANVAYLDHDIGDWPGVVAANFVVDLAVTRLLHAMRGSSFKPLRMSLEKMLDEERYHAHHGRGWLRTLATRSDDARRAIEERVLSALNAVVEWFGPEDDEEDGALVAAGVKSETNPDVLQDFLADVARTTAPLGMTIEVQRPAASSEWDPRTRRTAATGPDEEILRHLAGSKNAIFKLR